MASTNWSQLYSHCPASQFPYSEWSTPFQQIKEVVDGAAPRLPDDGRFSSDLRDMVALCLDKDHLRRPNFPQLLQHPFLKLYAIRIRIAASLLLYSSAFIYIVCIRLSRSYQNYRKEELACFISEVLDANVTDV